jgi:aryl-alcohol dehydrogenase-like predicted oxidoreductase
MNFRKFARSNKDVSRLGYGAWGIGGGMWRGEDDAESKKTLHKAIESGVTLFDSAFVYGNGHSEQLLGEVEKESGQELFLTSKVPPKNMQWPAKDDTKLKEAFPTDYIIEMTEKSLRNFNRDYIDLQQFHVWNDAWAGQDEWKEAVLKLKEQGKVRYFGISINDHQPANGMKAGETGMIDSFQVIFNIFDQSPTDELFPFCLEKNIAILARVPFDEGSLTGMITPETVFPEKDWRNHYFRGDRKQQVWERVQKIQEEIAGECDTIAEAALRYIVGFEAVTTVIPGMRKERNLLANVKSVGSGQLSDGLMERLKAHRWERNFYR